MRRKNRGGIFITYLGLIGILIFIAGLSMVLASQGQWRIRAVGAIPMIIGGLIVFEVYKNQKK
jgi:uncharacterized membrane protein